METMAVIAILAILASAGAKGYSGMVLDGNIQTVSTTLQNYTSNIEDGIFDLGYISWASDDDAEADVLVYLYELEDKYLNFGLSYDSMSLFNTDDYWGFTITTSPDSDPWGQAYQLTYLLDDINGLQIMIACAGPDSNWSERVTNYYQTGDYGDDIVMVMGLR